MKARMARTRIVDRTGRPYDVRHERLRCGFTGGDFIADDEQETVTLGSQPDRETKPRDLGGVHEEETLR